MKHKTEIIPLSDMLSYEESKMLDGGSTIWEARFTLENSTPRQLIMKAERLKAICKVNNHNHALAIQYTVCKSEKIAKEMAQSKKFKFVRNSIIGKQVELSEKVLMVIENVTKSKHGTIIHFGKIKITIKVGEFSKFITGEKVKSHGDAYSLKLIL